MFLFSKFMANHLQNIVSNVLPSSHPIPHVTLVPDDFLRSAVVGQFRITERYIAAFRYLLALLARLLPVYYRLGLLLLMVLLGSFQTDAGNKTKENTCND